MGVIQLASELYYMAKNNWFKGFKNRIEQCFAAHGVHSCQQY